MTISPSTRLTYEDYEVKVFRLIDTRYHRVAEISLETGGDLETPLLPGFTMEIAAVFRD